jgi:two-component system, NarL family, sensor histidine kinase DesK
VIRHSRAKHCRILLAQDGEEMYAEITDDGQGKCNIEATGSGLSGLAERVATFAGEVEAGPLPEGGFRLRVSLPAGSDAAQSAGPRLDGTFAGEEERR